LNSAAVTTYVKKVGSTGAHGSLRNIHKHPLDIALPRFDPNDTNHHRLAQIAESCEQFVKNFVQSLTQNKDLSTHPTLKSMQNRLMHDEKFLRYTAELDQILADMKIAL